MRASGTQGWRQWWSGSGNGDRWFRWRSVVMGCWPPSGGGGTGGLRWWWWRCRPDLETGTGGHGARRLLSLLHPACGDDMNTLIAYVLCAAHVRAVVLTPECIRPTAISGVPPARSESRPCPKSIWTTRTAAAESGIAPTAHRIRLLRGTSSSRTATINRPNRGSRLTIRATPIRASRRVLAGWSTWTPARTWRILVVEKFCVF